MVFVVAKQTVRKHVALGQSLYLFTVSQARNVEVEGGLTVTRVARLKGKP